MSSPYGFDMLSGLTRAACSDIVSEWLMFCIGFKTWLIRGGGF